MPDCRAVGVGSILLAGMACTADARAGERAVVMPNGQPACAEGVRRGDHGHGPPPATERLTDRTLILPIFDQMAESGHARVVDGLRAAAGTA